MKLPALICLLFVSSINPGLAAQIGLKDTGSEARSEIYLHGDIEPGDLLKLKSVFESKSRVRYGVRNIEIVYLEINSKGGLLDEAMDIGRYVRQNKITVTMAMNSECFSSCVYILAAGITKSFISPGLFLQKIGIHRPYFLLKPNEGVDLAMKNAIASSRTYFSEMNIPGQIVDEMFSTPPSQIKILSDEQLTTYRLNMPDIAWEEEMELEQARFHGMSRQEYMLKKRLADAAAEKCLVIKKLDEGRKCIRSAYDKYGFRRD